MTAANKCREAFEKFCELEHMVVERHWRKPDEYEWRVTQLAWRAYQDAWSAKPEEAKGGEAVAYTTADDLEWLQDDGGGVGQVEVVSRKTHFYTLPLYTHPPRTTAGEDASWRCFHCGECFDDRESAVLHFGVHEGRTPACLIDVTEYRAMEARMDRYVGEDTDLHRAMYRMENQHQQALRRAEEDGYARGLKDATPSAQRGEVSHG